MILAMSYNGQVIVSNEEQFIYHNSENRGHVQLPRMLVNCLNLSGTAKIAYGVISGYVFEHGRQAFPSVSRIAMACNCSKKTAIKYIDELVNNGFIIKERNGNRKTNTYYIVDIDKIAHLHVSEMFWRAINYVYKEVETCHYEDVHSSLMNFLEKIEGEGIVFNEIPVSRETEEQIKESLLNRVKKNGYNVLEPLKFEVKSLETPTNLEVAVKLQNNRDSAAGTMSSFFSESNRYKLPGNIVSWSNDHFVTYFYDKHIDLTGSTHESNRCKHRITMGRIVKNTGGNKEKVKRHIDAFFEMGYELLTIEWFCALGRTTEIDLFITTGKRPFEVTNHTQKEFVEPAFQEERGMSPDDFLRRIKGSRS